MDNFNSGGGSMNISRGGIAAQMNVGHNGDQLYVASLLAENTTEIHHGPFTCWATSEEEANTKAYQRSLAVMPVCDGWRRHHVKVVLCQW